MEKKEDKNVLKNILERWKKNELVETTLVQICEDKECDEDDFLCSTSITNAEEGVHSIHNLESIDVWEASQTDGTNADELINLNRYLEELWKQSK